MTALLGLAAALLLVRLVIFVAIHRRFRGFSVLRNTVSDYGVGPSRSWYTVMGLLSALAYAFVAAALWIGDVTPVWLRVVPSVATVGSMAIMAFPTDPTGSERRTVSGGLHWLLAILNFALIFAFVTNAELGSARSGAAATLVVLLWATRVSFYAFLVTLVVPALRRRLVGLPERVFLVCVPLWFVTFNIGFALG